MVDFQPKDRYSMDDLLEIMRLRVPEGCPWDRGNRITRAFAPIFWRRPMKRWRPSSGRGSRAAEGVSWATCCDQVVFHACVRGRAEFLRFRRCSGWRPPQAEVISSPHVAPAQADDAEQVLKNWDAIKRETRRCLPDGSLRLLAASPARCGRPRCRPRQARGL